MEADWTFEAADAAVAETLQATLPTRLFDAHTHLYRRAELSLPPNHLFTRGPDPVDPQVWRQMVGRQMGEDRLVGGLFLPLPLAPVENADCINRWMLDAVRDLPEARALALITPDMKPSQIEPLLDDMHFAGFKPYHVHSRSKPTFDAPPEDYIPEWAWEMAHAHGLVFTLHVVRTGAMADEQNIAYIRDHCERYPNARLIMAHAGRAFHAPNAAAGANRLRDLQNLWFDTSAVCEEEPFRVLLDTFGPRRLMWGSDFPVSELRGRCVTAGDGFVWLTPEMAATSSPPCRLLPVGLESLRALQAAIQTLGLNAEDAQDIYADNARRLLGLLPAVSNQGQDLYRHAKSRMPGGTQLLSKRPEMMAPDQWPAYFREARGCEVWDLDGRHFYDMSTNGIGCCLLGYADPEVTSAVRRRITLGSMSSLNPPEEVALADALCELHPWAEQARFGRCGGEACAMAVRIARATTDRPIVAICGYSGWHDWYLAANLGDSEALRGHLLPGLDPLGVPGELRGTTVTFSANDRAGFEALLKRHGDRLAAVVMEPCRYHDPEPGFLEFVREGAHRVGALLIFDEITIGWRLHHGGAHLRFGVAPDLAIYAKALGNGHPIAAVIGTREAMHGAHGSFISSTYWTESVGPVAALATLKKLAASGLPAHVAHVGSSIQGYWREAARSHGLDVQVSGYPCLAHVAFQDDQAAALRTLYTQAMLDRGFLAGPSIYPTLAHTEQIVAQYGEAINEVFAELRAALDGGDVAAKLRGPIAHQTFRRLTD